MKLAEIFHSGMTLQRSRNVKIWGTCDQAEQLRVCWNGEQIWQGDIGPGDFSLTLPPIEAFENGTLAFSDGTVLSDVDIGEVWIAGGQSNMEFPLACDRSWEAARELPSDDHLRFYDVGEYGFPGEREEGLNPDAAHWDRWMAFDSEDRGFFSAVGAWFGLQLRRELKVPVAIVGCNWGGTTASTWMDAETLAADPALSVYLKDYEAATKTLDLEKYIASDRKMRESASTPKSMEFSRNLLKNEAVKKPGLLMRVLMALAARNSSTGPRDKNRPGGLYEMMLTQVTGFGCRGVLWYQGESDDHHPELYSRLFSAMISVWRRDWGEELPFFFTQLAPFEAWMACKGVQYPVLRQQQQIVEDTVPGAYMASIMDVGSRYDIHPKQKQPVGERLALLALNKVYGLECDGSAPRLREIARNENGLTVTFDQKMTASGDFSSLFTLTCGGRSIPFTAKLEGGRVELAARIPAGTQLAFAYQPYCVMTLTGANGLPARPFPPMEV